MTFGNSLRLWENETDQDCYRMPGDTIVHYSPPAGAEDRSRLFAQRISTFACSKRGNLA